MKVFSCILFCLCSLLCADAYAGPSPVRIPSEDILLPSSNPIFDKLGIPKRVFNAFAPPPMIVRECDLPEHMQRGRMCPPYCYMDICDGAADTLIHQSGFALSLVLYPDCPAQVDVAFLNGIRDHWPRLMFR